MKVARFLPVAGVIIWASLCAAQSADVHKAARSGDVARLRELIDASPALLDAKGEEDDTPLHIAAMTGRTEAALYLVRRGANIEARNTSNQSPLLYAAYVGNAALVDTLISRGAQFDYQDARGNSPVLFAARGGHLAVVERLAAKGAKLDLRGNLGRTPLYAAAMNGHAGIVKLLLSRGARSGTKDDSGTAPVTIALANGHAAAAEAILDAGAAIEGDGAALGRFIHLAAAGGSQRIVDTLAARGVSLDGIDERGRTLLHDAAIGGLPGLASTMIAHSKKIDAPDGNGKTALHYAVSKERRDIIDLLLAAGADPNIADADGRTPLHIAEDNVEDDIAKLLRQKGARETERRIYRLTRESAVRQGSKASSAPLEITYIANEGFLIARGEKKVLIDALHANPWNYPMTGDRIFSMMLEKRPPFDGVDLSIVSHAHSDHMSARMNAELLKRHPGIAFLSSPMACDSVRGAAGEGLDAIAGRIVSVDPAWKDVAKLQQNGIDAEFFGVNHAGLAQEPYKTLATIVDLDGIRLVHMADEIVESNAENYRAVDLARDGIDIAFADIMFLADSTGQRIMKEYIKPQYIILMHSGPSELDDAERRLRPLYPNFIIYRDQLEKKVFGY